jgi:hypothetical protein
VELLVLGGVLTRGGRNETGAEVVLHGEVGRRRWPLRGRAHRFSQAPTDSRTHRGV